MSAISSYLKTLLGAKTLAAAAEVIERETGRTRGALEVAIHRGLLPGYWYADIARLAAERGQPAPPEELFRLRRDPPTPRSNEAA